MKAREFWINYYGTGSWIAHYSFERAESVTNAKREIIHVREVSPDEITDTERLKWIIENGLSVLPFWGGYRVYREGGESIREFVAKTPREAIDAAMKAEQEKKE